MKLPVLTLLLSICFSFTTYSQIKIGDNPQTIDASSVLELESTSHVLVITRVTTAEMSAIVPKQGGLVYNTDTQCVYHYNGTDWMSLCDGAGSISNLTTDPSVNDFRTIIITPDGDTNHIEVGIIHGSQIQENSISGTSIAENSITDAELAQNSVTSFQIDDRSLQADDFANTTANQVLGTDTNGIVNWMDASSLIISSDTPNSITTGTDGGAFYDDTPLQTAISDEETRAIAAETINSNAISDEATRATNAEVANTTLINNHITTDEDTNATNEIQTISILGNTISLTDGGSFNLPPGTVNTDSQTLSIALNSLAITGGNAVNLNPYLDNTDEQQLSISGNRITLTDGGFVDLPTGTVDTDEQNITGGAIVGSNLRIDIENGNSGLIDISSLTTGSTIIVQPTKISGTGVTLDPYTIAPNAITAAEIDNESILSEDIVDGTITGNDISNGNVTPIKIAPGTTGQILTTSATGVVWEDPTPSTVNVDTTIDGDGSTTTPFTIADDAITTVKILDNNVTIDKIEASLTDGQILTTSGTDVVWANAQNLSNSNLTQTSGEDRTYDLNGSDLAFIGTGSIGIGTGANPPSNKLHVAGAIRSQGFLNSSGSSNNEPSYRFNDDTDTGFWNPAADEVSFVVGSVEALRIRDEGTTDSELVVNGSLELKEQLLDENGNSGNIGDVLTATSTGTEWKSPQIVAMGKANGGNSIKRKGVTINGSALADTIRVTFDTPRPDDEYTIQLTVFGNNRIFVKNQTTDYFDVSITDLAGTSFIISNWYFTILDF